MTDDQGYGDLRCHGNTMIRTPNLDRLHSQSVRLANFHVDPTCSPTRAALLTGRYSTRAGVWHTIMGRSLLYHDEITLADVLAAHGYRNGIFGKWHLGDNYPMRPEDRGFHEVVVHGGGGVGQTPDSWGNDYTDDHYRVIGGWKPFRGYCTEVFFNEAIDFIRRHRNQPFFVYLPTNVPHAPFNAPPNLAAQYRARGVPEPMASFYAMIEDFDANLGRLMAQLKQWQLDENTIVIFMTDNGTAAGVAPRLQSGSSSNRVATGADRDWRGFDAAMRAQKGSVYEGGHRVPCFIRWLAGGLSEGRDVRQLTAHFDLLPTLVELAELQFHPRHPLDGRSLVPLLKPSGAPWPERTLFVHTQREEIPPQWTRSVVMTERWRLVHGSELYDIQADPRQLNDVALQFPQIVTALRGEYEQWWNSLQPAFDRYGWIVVGSPNENPSMLNCMDWHASQNDIPWNQSMINQMPAANGYWMIELALDGSYEFTLRHKPAVARFPLQATEARVKVGHVESSAAVPAGADAVSLQLSLKKGRARMQTFLRDARKGIERGAFFVEVRRIGDTPPRE